MVLVGALAWIAARRRHPDHIWLITGACVLAYASHLGLDWLGGDTKLPAGIQLLWPLSDAWFVSSWNIFRPTDLGGALFTPRVMLSNSLVVLRELSILAPIALCAWVVRRRRCNATIAREPRVRQNLSAVPRGDGA
jgi:hypothetical protein